MPPVFSTILNSDPFPRMPKASPSLEIGAAPVSWSATPRAISIMPSVATKGVIRILVTTKPLTRPHAAPATIPSAIAGAVGTPAFTASPVTTPDSARTDPTLRSIPPVMMTRVMPMPSRPITEV